MYVGFQFESFVYLKPNGGTRPVRFQSAPGHQGDTGGAAIPEPARASPGVPAPPPAGLHHDYGMARFTIYVILLGVNVVNSCRQSCAMRCNPSAGAGAWITS